MKAREAVSVGGERRWKYLQRDVPIELDVARALHLAHAACTDGGDDFIRPEMNAGTE